MATVEGSTPAAELPQVRLKISRRSSHPWIFQKMVAQPASRLHAGTVVDIIDRDGQWVGRGFYNGHSRIALRLLTSDPAEKIDRDFFARRLERAVRGEVAGPVRRRAVWRSTCAGAAIPAGSSSLSPKIAETGMTWWSGWQSKRGAMARSPCGEARMPGSTSGRRSRSSRRT